MRTGIKHAWKVAPGNARRAHFQVLTSCLLTYMNNLAMFILCPGFDRPAVEILRFITSIIVRTTQRPRPDSVFLTRKSSGLSADGQTGRWRSGNARLCFHATSTHIGYNPPHPGKVYKHRGDSAITTTIRVLKRVRISRCREPRLWTKPCLPARVGKSTNPDHGRIPKSDPQKRAGESQVSLGVGTGTLETAEPGGLETVERVRQTSLIFEI